MHFWLWPWRLDLAWPEFKVAVEYDGHDHAQAVRRGRDLDRLEALRERGWIIIVITAVQLARPDRLSDQVRRALSERGWTGARATRGGVS